MTPSDLIALPSSDNAWDRTPLEMGLYSMVREALIDLEFGLKNYNHTSLEMAANILRDLVVTHKDKFTVPK